MSTRERLMQSQITLLIACIAALLRPGLGRGVQELALTITPNVKVTVNVSQTHDVPEFLYGIFFEEVRCPSRHSCCTSFIMPLFAN